MMKQGETRWPLNMRYIYRYDISPGERALVEGFPFCGGHLRLLCGVQLSDLSWMARTGAKQKPMPHGAYEYLICREEEVLLAIHLSDLGAEELMGPFIYVAGLPVVETDMERFARGDVIDILDELEDILRHKAAPVWNCRLQACPPELVEPMFREQMLEVESGGDTVPTLYGSCKGLVRVVERSGQSTMCTQRTAQSIQVCLSGCGRPAVSCRKERLLPFEERLKRHCEGLLWDDSISAQMVREVMDLPLREYMAGFPQELEELEERLPRQCGTYSEAACAVYDLLHKSCDELYELGIDLMLHLAAPPLEDEKIAQAVRMGRRIVGRDPDHMPERYHRDRKGTSFHDLVNSSGTAPGIRLAMGTQASFFQGVGVLAGSAYPGWRSHAIQTCLALGRRCGYGELLQLASLKLSDDNPWYVGLGTHLMYTLLIEPFYLIHQNSVGLREV